MHVQGRRKKFVQKLKNLEKF